MVSLADRRPLVAIKVCLLAGALSGLVAAEPPAVRGTVLGPDGSPVPGASVELRDPNDTSRSDEPFVAVETDENGRYSVKAPHAGVFRLVVTAPGRVAQERLLAPLVESRVLAAARLPDDAGLDVRVVRPDGSPVEGAAIVSGARPVRTVRFSTSPGEWTAARRAATTDEAGLARLPRAADEATRLAVVADGFAPAIVERVSGTATTVRLRTGSVRPIKVSDASGRPVASATIRLAQPGLVLAETDAEGRAEIRIGDTGELAIEVAAAGRGSAEVRIARTASDRIKVVRLPEIGLVAGRVLDAANRRAVAGAVVWPRDDPASAIRTDRSGGYVLELPLGSTARIDAAATGYLRPDAPSFPVGDDGRPGPAIALTPGAYVEGNVVDEGGAAVAGATLAVSEKPAGGRMMMRVEIGGPGRPQAVADEDGAFRVGPIDPDTPWVLRASAPDHAPGSVDLVGLEPRTTRSDVRLVVSRGLALVGIAVDEEDEPIADAEVALEPSSPGGHGGIRMIGPGGPPPAPEPVVTGRDGRFRVAGLAPGTYDLRIRRSGFAPGRRSAIEMSADRPETDAGRIELRPGVVVQGRVVDDDGQPIEAAEVRLAEPGSGGMTFALVGSGPDDGPPDARSGADGWFVVPDLEPEQPTSLELSRTGYLTVRESDVEVPGLEPLEIVMQASSLLAGTVRDTDGAPIVGANVTMTRSVSATMGNRVVKMIGASEQRTDGEGRFRFEGERPGTVSLSVSAPGWQDTELDGIEIPRGADRDDVEIALEPGAVLVGRISAPDGRPVAGAEVSRVEAGGGEPRFGLGGGASSDGDGYYRLEGLEPGAHSIEVTHPSYVRTVRDVDADPGINGLDFEFEGGQAVRGTVLDASGAPVSAAWIQLTPSGQRWGGPEASTDPDGRFEIAGVADGDYVLHASAEGYAPYRGDDRVSVQDAPVDGVVVRLEPGATISGRIVGVDRDRLGEVSIEAFGLDGGGFVQGSVTSSGEYRVEGAGPGRWRVEATMARAGKTASGEVTLEPGALDGRVDLEFGTGLTLRGIARLGGRPFSDAAVSASGRDVMSSAMGRTDRDGAFTLEGLEPGTYVVDLRQWSTGISYRESVELTSDREVEIELPVARVTGRVVDAVDREGVAGVSLSLVATESGESGPFSGAPSAVSDVNGAFHLENVPDGSWQLVARREGYATRTDDIVVREGRDVSDLDVRIDPTEGLHLKVLTPSGRAPDTITAAVIDASGRVVESGQFATGERGTVRLSRVPPGSWTVALRAPGTGTATVQAMAPGAPTEVRLPQSCTVQVVVPELDGSPILATGRLVDSSGVPHRRVDWFGGTGEELRFAGGTLSVDGVKPDDWTVVVTTSDGRTWNGRVATTPSSPARVELR